MLYPFAKPTQPPYIETYWSVSAGLDYWPQILDSGAASVAQVLTGFGESAENQAALIGTISQGISYLPFQ